MLHAVWEYLKTRQTPQIRFLHIVALLLVISQIFVSNFIGFTNSGDVSRYLPKFLGTWAHIITGIALLPIALAFVLFLIREHGIRHFFPYLYADFTQVKRDMNKLIKFELPEPAAGGLAAIVEGLGLGALFLALLSGLMWFITWQYNLQWSHNLKEIHESVVGLVEAYIIGHGLMGLLHLYLSTRNRSIV